MPDPQKLTVRYLPAIGLAVSLVVFAVDQVSKWIIVTYVMNPPRAIPVTSFFNLVLSFNKGVSFGAFASEKISTRFLLSAVASVIIIALVIWLFRVTDRLESIGLGGIIGGAFGNLVDRIHQGAVTDFLDFYVGEWHWPAFNMADTAITLGVVCLLVSSLRSSGTTRPREESQGR